MASTLSPLTFSPSPRLLSITTKPPHLRPLPLAGGGRRNPQFRPLRLVVASSPSTPPDISEKVQQSIKNAEEVCADDAVSGECVAAWDEVEELSAAASHARDKLKDSSDPLEEYCDDNPETDECRTYDN